MPESSSFLDAVAHRRTVYAIGNEAVVPDRRVLELVEHTLLHSPSPYNIQTTRALALFGADHQHLWLDIAYPALQKVVPEEMFNTRIGPALKSFAGGHGTVLLFEDQDTIKQAQEIHLARRDASPEWSIMTSAMAQYVLWTALSNEGMGVSDQHQSPFLAAGVAAKWNVPANWTLKSQLVYGKPLAPAGEKTFKPLAERLMVAGL